MEPTRTDTANTLPADWLEAAGTVNVAAADPAGGQNGNENFVSIEQIMLWDPDVIVVNEAAAAAEIRGNKQWSGLRAVAAGKVYLLPSGVSRWGHPSSLETPLAVLWMAKTLYPALFADIDLAAETKNFYHQYFDCDLSDADVQKILSGQGIMQNKK